MQDYLELSALNRLTTFNIFLKLIFYYAYTLRSAALILQYEQVINRKKSAAY